MIKNINFDIIFHYFKPTIALHFDWILELFLQCDIFCFSFYWDQLLEKLLTNIRHKIIPFHRVVAYYWFQIEFRV